MSPNRSLEQVEDVDSDGLVRRTIPRWQMREENALHRSVYIAVVCVVGSQVCLVVHRRSTTKDVNPGLWDVAFGGVCGVGESPGQAARRELEEEAGIGGVELTSLGTGLYEDSKNRVLGTVFLARYQGELIFVDGEVIDSRRVRVEQIDDWVSSTPVCLDSVSLVLPRVRAYLDSAAI